MGSALTLFLFLQPWLPSLTFARALEREGDLEGALRIYRQEILPQLPDDSLKLDLIHYTATLLAELKGPDSALAFLQAYSPFQVQGLESPPQEKNPLYGLMLSLFPGGGYLYCGQTDDALQTLELHALLGVGLVFALRERRPLATGVYGAFLGLYYLGNLYGGYRCIRERNRLAWWRHFSQTDRPPRRGWLPSSPELLALKRRALLDQDRKAFRTLMKRFAEQGDFVWGVRYARLFAAAFPGPESEAWTCYFLLGLGHVQWVLRYCSDPRILRAAREIRRNGEPYVRWSAFLPGSGLLAQGRIKDGLISFGLNALTAYGIARSLLQRHYWDAFVLFTFFGPRFYLGGIELTRIRAKERWLHYARPRSP